MVQQRLTKQRRDGSGSQVELQPETNNSPLKKSSHSQNCRLRFPQNQSFRIFRARAAVAAAGRSFRPAFVACSPDRALSPYCSANYVGSATGRGLPRLAQGLTNSLVCGVEPVEALVRQGISSGVNQNLPLLLASGDALPFVDNSFDAVCEFGILHHVPDPVRVVQEMLRVARNVIVISDANRFGQGPLHLRVLKLLLFKFRLWSAFDFLRTHGKGYQVSEGDGVFYSYSVYDNYEQIQQWAESIFLFPIGETRSWTWFHPLLTSSRVLLIAVRKKSASVG